MTPLISWQQVYDKIGFRPSQSGDESMVLVTLNYTPPFVATCEKGIVTVSYDLTTDTKLHTQALESDAARAWELMRENIRNFAGTMQRISEAITPKATRDGEITVKGTTSMGTAPRSRGYVGMVGDHD